MEDEKQKYGLLIVMFSGSLFCLILDLYYYSFNFFHKYGLYNDFFVGALKYFRENFHFFSNSFNPKYYVVGLFVVGLLGNRPRRSTDLNKNNLLVLGGAGVLLFFLPNVLKLTGLGYLIMTLLGYPILVYFIVGLQKIIHSDFLKDRFDEENSQCLQNDNYQPLDTSVNIPYTYYYQKKKHTGWINIVNPFRAVLVCGVPGSGKTFCILEEAIRQLIQKGFAMCVYDYKFPDLSETTWSYLCNYMDCYDVKPKFYVINFDDVRYSHRCNPLQPELIDEFTDAQQAAKTIMIGINSSWVKKEGDFFVESPINLSAAGIWCLKLIDSALGTNKYCTFPHLVEMLSLDYDDMFGMLTSMDDLSMSNTIAPFTSAYAQGATDQLEGQVASVRLGLSRLTSPTVYWIMTGSDFTLKINDPDDPKVLCIGNNPDRQDVYKPLISLYCSKMLKIINHKGRRRCGLFFDELPTVYLGGDLSNLINTGRSNKLATFMGIQDFSQIIRDYSKEMADTIINNVGSLITGQVGDHTAEQISKRFGKIKVERRSLNYSRTDVTENFSEAMEDFVKVGQLCKLSQGQMAGVLADDVKAPMDFSMFFGKVNVDMEAKKLGSMHKLPMFTDFGDVDVQTILSENMLKVKREMVELCELLNFKYEHTDFGNAKFLKDKIDRYILYTRKPSYDKIHNLIGDQGYDSLVDELANQMTVDYNEMLNDASQSTEKEFIVALGKKLKENISKKVDSITKLEHYEF